MPNSYLPWAIAWVAAAEPGALLDDDVDAGLGPELLGGVGPDVGAFGQPTQIVFHRDLLLREDRLRHEAGAGDNRCGYRRRLGGAALPWVCSTPCASDLPIRQSCELRRNMHANGTRLLRRVDGRDPWIP